MSNPLLCDPDTGFCEIPGAQSETGVFQIDAVKPIKVIYFTDPICSSCWAIEPQLRKIKLEYGDILDIEYRMGGLLPDWSYNSGGISKASDVAHHWDEVSAHYDMPIDGDVWLEDPLHSSYPPSIAFKAAQLQDQSLSIQFLREMREMVFIEKKNIARWEHIEEATSRVGLDTLRLKSDYHGDAKFLFQKDLDIARSMGVRGFPTMFFTDEKGNKELVYGSKQYAFFETAILKLMPSAEKQGYEKDWEALFNRFGTLTAKEFSILSDTPRSTAEKLLDRLVEDGALEKATTKNGSIWKRRNS